MSLQTDAEQIRDLAQKIIEFEIQRAVFVANGGKVRVIEGISESDVTLTAQQRQTLLAQEATWQTAIKNISAAW